MQNKENDDPKGFTRPVATPSMVAGPQRVQVKPRAEMDKRPSQAQGESVLAHPPVQSQRKSPSMTLTSVDLWGKANLEMSTLRG
ncbi:hypothetical protein OYC64_012948 [Pagothenia borchgrevinki]|uniref:Uncharacterized protein n=1 Tax=Pagothenia borchgrevinki TaxID=8213 RepID=A0ABD2FS64_PAGBO